MTCAWCPGFDPHDPANASISHGICPDCAKKMEAQSLFDDEPELSKTGSSPRSAWQEVPQARFLSWTPAEQLAYCAARDEDAALTTLDQTEVPFYQARAATYKEMQHATTSL